MEDRKIVIILLIALVAGLPLMYFVGTMTASSNRQTLSISGSTTVLPIAQKWAEKIMEFHSNLDVQVSGGGSGVGIEECGLGLNDLGMSSKPIPADDLITYPNLINHTVALDGIAMAVNKASVTGIENLTWDQIACIYNGTYTHWINVTPTAPATPIVAYGRASTSGTYEFFYKVYLDKLDNYTVADAFESNAGVQAVVKSVTGAIGYLGLGYLNDPAIKVLNVIDDGGIAWYPLKASVQNFSYPISRALYLVSNGPIQNGSLAEMFLNFALSSVGQEIVELPGIDYVELPYVPFYEPYTPYP